MATITLDQSYPRIDAYWILVGETLKKVFGVQDEKVVELVKGLQNEVQEGSLEEQVIFYHAEPLDVAADLAGTDKAPTSEQVSEYLKIAKEAHWGLRKLPAEAVS